MNKYIKYTALGTLTAAFSLMTTGCLDEVYPIDDELTKDQLVHADKASLAAAIPAYMITFTNYYNDGLASDIGFPGFGIWRDTMTADFPLYSTEYDYYPNYCYTMSLYNGSLQTLFWRRYYYLIHHCNNIIGMSSYSPDSPDAPYLGMALAYRSMAYFDLVRMYEFKHTGVAELDDLAAERGIQNLTVPKILPETTEEESRNAVRTPIYEMYRFMMDDLNKAEVLLQDYPTAQDLNYVSLGAVYGFKARLWLEIATRFDLHADDLARQLELENDEALAIYDKLAVTSAKDCYAKAAYYARKAIDMGYTPTTESQWYDPNSGFNTPTSGWMMAYLITADSGLAKNVEWQSWVPMMSPECSYGVADQSLGAYRMIDARLFSQMDANDWRRYTWIAPSDVANSTAYNAHYKRGTLLPYNEWSKYAAYTGFKWHPGSGDRNTTTVGNAVSIPMMRVEEMYLIEAEALAKSEGAGTGKSRLESFMNTFRMDAGKTYTVKDASLDGVLTAILTQKRIEFWGEGLILWDYRRREIPIERGYPGSNHYKEFWFNSYPNAVAPWTNICIPERVQQLNPSFPLNPDPSLAIPKWTE